MQPEPPPALKAKFLERLRERLRRLDELRRETTADALVEMRTLAHALSGSAGTFGFRTLGDAARRVEDLLIQAADPMTLARAVQDLLAEGERAEGALPAAESGPQPS